MEFGVVGSCLADHPWRDFVAAASRLGVETIELDTRSGAHCNTWSRDVDPKALVADLSGRGLRVSAVAAFTDLVQKEEPALKRQVEELQATLALAFAYRTEVVRIAPQRPKHGMSREAMLESIARGCKLALEFAEEHAMLVCLQNDSELLRDAEALRWLIAQVDSYNVKVALDAVEFLRALRDVEAVRANVAELVPEVSHVVLRDAKLNPATGEVTETAVGDGECPVEMVVSEMMAANFFRPFHMAYSGDGETIQALKRGIDYFRDLPNRLLAEVGML